VRSVNTSLLRSRYVEITLPSGRLFAHEARRRKLDVCSFSRPSLGDALQDPFVFHDALVQVISKRSLTLVDSLHGNYVVHFLLYLFNVQDIC
jgi:hypothetical protein